MTNENVHPIFKHILESIAPTQETKKGITEEDIKGFASWLINGKPLLNSDMQTNGASQGTMPNEQNDDKQNNF